MSLHTCVVFVIAVDAAAGFVGGVFIDAVALVALECVGAYFPTRGEAFVSAVIVHGVALICVRAIDYEDEDVIVVSLG